MWKGLALEGPEWGVGPNNPEPWLPKQGSSWRKQEEDPPQPGCPQRIEEPEIRVALGERDPEQSF